MCDSGTGSQTWGEGGGGGKKAFFPRKKMSGANDKI